MRAALMNPPQGRWKGELTELTEHIWSIQEWATYPAVSRIKDMLMGS